MCMLVYLWVCVWVGGSINLSFLFLLYFLSQPQCPSCATAPALTDSLDELVEEHGALPDDPGCLGLLILAPAEGQAVVHSTLFM